MREVVQPPLRCFHSMPAEALALGKMVADPAKSSKRMVGWNRWLQKQIGFYPLYLAFGSDHAIANTFYNCSNPNNVLAIFPFDTLEFPWFTDHDVWLSDRRMSIDAGVELPKFMRQRLFKPSYSFAAWCRLARRDPMKVQILVPELDFTKASQVWVQDCPTRHDLAARGCQNVVVHRVDDDELWG